MTAEAVELLPPALGERGEAYDRWLKARQEPSEEYLRSETRVRFEARDDDVLVALPGVGAVRAPGGAELRGGPLSRAIALPGVDAEVARRFLAALSGESSLAEACRASGLAGDARGALLAAAFGVTLFAPFAVTELERRVSGVELVRFPGAPYEIERPYWQNMAAVRDRAPELEAALGEPLAALATLSRLHVVALIGERGDSFYRPTSRVAQNGVSPSRCSAAAGTARFWRSFLVIPKQRSGGASTSKLASTGGASSPPAPRAIASPCPGFARQGRSRSRT